MFQIFFFLFLITFVLLIILFLDQKPGPARTKVVILFADTVEEDLKDFVENRPAIGGRLHVVA